ncbi:MAG TPA: neutral zinc metallopeptidase [Vicinamibacterales bacterium]|nr:neutral zinc metallopeptidase [Vicinamibacterales bacterium]
MKWTAGDRSNVEDARGSGGIGGRAVPIGLGGFILLALLSWATGTNFLSLLSGPTTDQTSSTGPSAPVSSSPGEEREVDFVDAVMKDVQSTWTAILPGTYQPTRVVLFRDAIDSACGMAQSATGPFYCPQDSRVYLDLGFFQELSERFGAPGDFARAYVIAHEVGHHVQRLTGIERQMRAAQQRDPSEANPLSVRLELQADCFAGVWGHAASKPGRAASGQVELETGDVEEGLRAAAAIGDDRLQRMSTGRVMPDRFTHGSSEQRVEWFRRGLSSGRPEACDTFGNGSIP